MDKKKIVAIVLFLLFGTAIYTFANPQKLEEIKLDKKSKLNTDMEDKIEDSEKLNQVMKQLQVQNQNGNVATITRDEKVPTLSVTPECKVILKGDSFNVMTGVVVENGYSVVANITNTTTLSIGTHKITYTLKYANGVVTATRTIKVLDPKADEDNDGFTNQEEMDSKSNPEDKESVPTLTTPVIVLLGDNPYEMERTNAYVEAGGLAKDSLDKELEIGYTCNLDKSVAGEYTCKYAAIDRQGNYVIEIRNIKVVDTIAPTATVTYSNNNGSEATNKDVTATLTANEKVQDISGWTKINDTTFTKEYSENGKYSVEIIDLAGNTSTINYEVKRIDKIKPVITGVENGKHYNADVTYGIVEQSISIIIVDGVSYNTKNAPYTITEEGTHTVKVIDKAENESDEITFIIDKTSATATVAYSNNGSTITNKDVTVTLTANEKVQDIAGWTKINDTTFTKEYSENGKYSVEIIDLAGNTSTINYEVKRIDKIKPVITGVENGKHYNADVTYGIVEQSISIIIVDGVSYNTKNAPYTITEEGTHTVKVIDKAENESDEITFIIDKTSATATVAYSNNGSTITNKDVTVTLTANEKVQDIAGWTKINDTTLAKDHDANGKYTVEIKDLAGNITIVSYEVKRIDKINPVITGVENGEQYNTDVTYGIVEQNVSAIIVDGVSYNAKNALYTITEEGTHTIKVTDKAGNESEEVTFIIDKTII